MISDASCLIGRTADQMAESPPIPALPKAEWFDPPTQAELDLLAVDRAMIDVTVCGPDIGKILGVVAIDGIPFRTPYGDLIAPNLADVDVSEINDRRENLLRVDRGGTIEETPAGKFRFGHSPDFLDTLEMLHAFHDQNEGTLARFRLYPATLAGKTALIMKGSVLASVLEPGTTGPRPITYADLDQLHNAETSPEWYEDEQGRFTYIAHSFVGEGNTNMFTEDERAAFRAEIRKAKPMTTEQPEPAAADHACDTCDERDAAAKAAAEADRKQAWEDMQALVAKNREDITSVVEHLMSNASAKQGA